MCGRFGTILTQKIGPECVLLPPYSPKNKKRLHREQPLLYWTQFLSLISFWLKIYFFLSTFNGIKLLNVNYNAKLGYVCWQFSLFLCMMIFIFFKSKLVSYSTFEKMLPLYSIHRLIKVLHSTKASSFTFVNLHVSKIIN